jgi:hypothetical protein
LITNETYASLRSGKVNVGAMKVSGNLFEVQLTHDLNDRKNCEVFMSQVGSLPLLFNKSKIS